MIHLISRLARLLWSPSQFMKPLIIILLSYFNIIKLETDVSSNIQLIDKLRDSAWYAAAAFCTDEQLTGYECNSCQVSGTRFIKSFGGDSIKTRGYLAQNDDKKHIILSFRGSQNNVNIIFDCLATLVPYGNWWKPRGVVHAGFLASTKSLVPKFIKELEVIVKENPDYSIIVTGHSLGGAIAALVTEEIRTQLKVPDDQIELYTYGQPKTGDRYFAKWFNRQNFIKYRVVSRNDMVPHIKAQDYLGYRHHHNEIWLRGPRQNLTILLCNKVDYEDPECSSSIPQNQLDWEAHTFYFDTIFGSSAC